MKVSPVVVWILVAGVIGHFALSYVNNYIILSIPNASIREVLAPGVLVLKYLFTTLIVVSSFFLYQNLLNQLPGIPGRLRKAAPWAFAVLLSVVVHVAIVGSIYETEDKPARVLLKINDSSPTGLTSL